MMLRWCWLIVGKDSGARLAAATRAPARPCVHLRRVPRDPRILRLTGRHPLNCEPAMPDLMAAGFITPPSIHYVRNHGAAPRIQWSEHRLVINGLVDKPLSLSMDEIVALPSVTLPITLVCAGNR